MNKRRLIFLPLIAVFVLSLVLSGCSSKSTSGNASSSNSKPKVLIFGRGADTTSLDPAVVTDGESFKVTKNIYDTLLQFKRGTTELVPDLATKWNVSQDGKTVTLDLKQGVKFTNGEKFTAQSVVYNFNRWKSGDAGKFAYYASMFGGVGDKSVIQNVKADGDYKVVFTLKNAFAPFLKDLAMSPFAIASPKALKKYGDKYGINSAVGTGPFMFKSWKRKDTLTLVKNPNYFDGAPPLDKVIFKVIKDNQARLNALKNGEIDLMDGVSPDSLSTIKNDNKLQVFNRPPMNVGYVGFNDQKGPFKNPKVRVALNYAVDKKAMIKAFFNGQAVPAKNPIPKTIAGYNNDIKPYPFDLKKAKELLAKAGYPNGFSTELYTMTNPRPYMPAPQKIATYLKHNFAKIGVNVKIVTLDWTTYIKKTQEGDAPIFLLGWTGDNGDADNFLYTLLDKDNIGSNNFARFSNDQLHTLLIKAQKETDPKKRNDLYKQAQVIIHNQAPWIPLVHTQPLLAGSSKVTNFVPSPTGSDRLNKVDIKN